MGPIAGQPLGHCATRHETGGGLSHRVAAGLATAEAWGGG